MFQKKIKFDYVFELNFRNRFITTKDLETSLNIMELFKTDEVIGAQAEANRFYQHDGSGLKTLNKTSSLRLEREEIFKETGGLRVVKPKF